MGFFDKLNSFFTPKKTKKTERNEKDWVTKNFKWSEFACNDKNNTPVPEIYKNNVRQVADNLEILRSELGKPIKINSAYRTITHNFKVGGRPSSYHLKGMAVDIVVDGYTPSQIFDIIKRLMVGGVIKEGGLGLYDNFVHYDIRGKRVFFDYRKKI